MALNLAELIILGLMADWLFKKFKFPGLVGMLLLGMAVGPRALNLLGPSFIAISADLRMISLIVILVALALIARSLGTYLCLLGCSLNWRERMFVVISYVPKATVQAAIGGAPLVAMKLAGLPTGPGEIILAIAVLSILLTAPASTSAALSAAIESEAQEE